MIPGAPLRSKRCRRSILRCSSERSTTFLEMSEPAAGDVWSGAGFAAPPPARLSLIKLRCACYSGSSGGSGERRVDARTQPQPLDGRVSGLVKEPSLARLVSQDTLGSSLAILAAVMLITAGIMWVKAGATIGLSCIGVAAILAAVVLWRAASVRASVMRAIQMPARVTRNRVELIKHGRSIRRLHYEFDLDGRLFTGSSVTATHGPHEARAIGDPLRILVDPKRPSRTWLIEQFVPDAA